MALLGNTEENYKATVEWSDKKKSEYSLHSGKKKEKKENSNVAHYYC